MTSSTLLEVRQLSKKLCRQPRLASRYASADLFREALGLQLSASLRPGEFWALRDLSFSLARGEVLGIVGSNGAGKSTLLRLVGRLLRPTSGELRFFGRGVAILDPQTTLESVETGRENITLRLTLLGIAPERMAEEVDAVIEFSELGDVIDAPVGTYSAGMKLRLGFSVWTRVNPDLFIVDEAISGGDLDFDLKFKMFVKKYVQNGGSMLLCSHELHTIATLCERTMLLQEGQMLLLDQTYRVLHRYKSEVRLSRAECAEIPTVSSKDSPATPPIGLGTLTSVSVRSDCETKIWTGSPVTIQMTFSLCFEGLVLWGLEIGSDELSPLVTVVTNEQGMLVHRGLNTFRCDIESLPLFSGRYHLFATVNELSTCAQLASAGHWGSRIFFEVDTPPSLAQASCRGTPVFLNSICTLTKTQEDSNPRAVGGL